jgi:hypothetical protein
VPAPGPTPTPAPARRVLPIGSIQADATLYIYVRDDLDARQPIKLTVRVPKGKLKTVAARGGGTGRGAARGALGFKGGGHAPARPHWRWGPRRQSSPTLGNPIHHRARRRWPHALVLRQRGPPFPSLGLNPKP